WRIEWVDVAEGVREPIVDVEGVVWWTGRTHRELQAELLVWLRDTWAVDRVCVDATGIGQATAEFLEQALNTEDREVVEPVPLSASRKSELGYGLIAAANGGRVRFYAANPEVDVAAREFWHEVEAARSVVRPSHLLAWEVPEWA